MLDGKDMDRLLEVCKEKGWTVRMHTHKKTKANWNKPSGKKNKS